MKLAKFFATCIFGLALSPILGLAAPIESEAFPETSPNTNITSVFENPATGAFGLNCRGSWFCGGCLGFHGDDGLWNIVQQIPDGRYYHNGEQAACNKKGCNGTNGGGICVFAQHHGDKLVTGATIKEKVARIMKHGCPDCGSCPIYAGNNGAKGEITVNFVSKPCGQGVCD